LLTFLQIPYTRHKKSHQKKNTPQGITPHIRAYAVLPMLARYRDAARVAQREHARITLHGLHSFVLRVLCVKQQHYLRLAAALCNVLMICCALNVSKFITATFCYCRWYAIWLRSASWPCSDIDDICFPFRNADDAQQHYAVQKLLQYVRFSISKEKTTRDTQIRLNIVGMRAHSIFEQLGKHLVESNETVQSN
jgi:hypothetical protein